MKTVLYIICVACIAVLAISRIGYYSSSRHGGAGYNTQGSKSGLPSLVKEPVLANAYRLNAACIEQDSTFVILFFHDISQGGGELHITPKHKALESQTLSIRFALLHSPKPNSEVIIQLLEKLPRNYKTPCLSSLLKLQYPSITLKTNNIDTFNNKRIISLENWEPI